jgi:hypothetical protein
MNVLPSEPDEPPFSRYDRAHTRMTRRILLQWLAAAAGTLPIPALRTWAQTAAFPGNQRATLHDLAALVLLPRSVAMARTASPKGSSFGSASTGLGPTLAMASTLQFCWAASLNGPADPLQLPRQRWRASLNPTGFSDCAPAGRNPFYFVNSLYRHRDPRAHLSLAVIQ